MLKSLNSFFKKSIIYFAQFIIIYIVFLLLFVDRNIDYLMANNQVIQNWVLFLIIVVLFLVLIRFKELLIQKLNNINIKFWIPLILLILFIYQCISIYHYYFYTGWDALTVRNAAFILIDHPEQLSNFNPYFSYHVNQLFITTILGTVLKIGSSFIPSNPYLFSLLVSILMIDLSGLFSILSVKEITKRNDLTFISLILFIIVFGLSPWASIPYTDTYSILFSILTFYIYIKDFKTPLKNYLKWFFIVFFTIIGGSIKPQVYIISIAIFIIELIKILDLKFKLKELMFIISIIIVSIFSTQSIYDSWMQRFDFKLWPERSFTYTHYIMTGLNPVNYGIYLDSDASISYEAATIEEREAANIEVIKERLSDYGILGFIDFFNHKTLINYNDGTFAWNGEGGFIVEIFDDKSFLSSFYKDLFYPERRNYNYFVGFSQFTWLLTLLLMLIGIFDKKNKNKLLLFLIFIGGFLFIQLFEARARYLIGYLPFYIILATLGFRRIIDGDFIHSDKIKLW